MGKQELKTEVKKHLKEKKVKGTSILGFIILIIGLLLLIAALNYDTGVAVGDGSGRRVNNLGKMNEKSNLMIISLAITAVGGVLLLIKRSRYKREYDKAYDDIKNKLDLNKNTKKCPYCAELISIEAKICKHCQKPLDVVT